MIKYIENSCDACGSNEYEEIKCLRKYTKNQPIHVCKNCGLIYVKKRRPPKKVADDWSNRIFSSSGNYTARIPAIFARQNFIADMIDFEQGLKNKTLCDIGAGEGQFLEIVRNNYFGKVFGIEPSQILCESMDKNKIENFCGTIEDFKNSNEKLKKFNFLTMMWTLECCADPNAMLRIAGEIIHDDGFIVVGTGSRILVPFKKPLHFYIDSSPLDTHPLRFSFNTLARILQRNGFEVVKQNRYIDQDWLCVIAQKTFSKKNKKFKDDYKKVIDFFQRWDQDTKKYYAAYKES